MLELIHTDMCEPITPTAMSGYMYFITFIDDVFRFDQIDILQEKSSSSDAFKSFKVIVEVKIGKKIKCERYEEVNIMEDMKRLEETHDLSPIVFFFLKNVVLKLNTLYPILLSKMELQKGKLYPYEYGETHVEPLFLAIFSLVKML